MIRQSAAMQWCYQKKEQEKSGMDQKSMVEKPTGTYLTRIQRFSHFIRRHWVIVVVTCVIIIAGIIFIRPIMTGKKSLNGERPQPVTAVMTNKADFDVYLKGLGTVIPANTVTVKSQVSGQLMSVLFKEGQHVNKGDLIAEIDPRPFQVQLMQAEGQLARDEAFLKNAESDLALYKQLIAQDSIAAQQVTTQDALVKQYRGVIETDKGQIANAKLQLIYARVIAPITGRVGLRQVDPGNMVQITDPNGIVVITQLQPVTVVFSLPQDNLTILLKRWKAGATNLPVQAYDQEGKILLASGTLLAIDNQIDTTTGTVKLKAIFDNKDNKLFPNQFVNVRLRVDTLHDATVMSSAAVQRGSIGTFAYAVKADKSVTVKMLKLGPAESDNVVIMEGLAPGESVVTVGGDKLREGTKVEIMTPDGKGTSGRREKINNATGQKARQSSTPK
jgi:multidrug efflux system membrane fusion protein